MRIIVPPAVLRRGLGCVQGALFAGAILMLGYCGFVVADTWMFQRQVSRELTQLVVEQPTAATPGSSPVAAVALDGLIGRIEVTRLGLSVVVMEGTKSHTLRHAIGHIEGTALPGDHGNIGLSGHRDTFFRPLRNIRQDDIIVLTTPAGEYRYRVVSSKVVSPDETSVLNSDGADILTLVTCYPFYFVGPAPDRFIVRAERVI